MALAALVLAACANQTAYGPKSYNGGYFEHQIEDTRFLVRFTGNTLTPRDRVEAFLLYRAAEITIEQGFAGFEIIDRSTETVTSYYHLDHDLLDRRYGREYRTRPHFNSGINRLTPVTSYDASAEIILLNPPFEKDQRQIYNARQVLDNLRPVVQLSQEPD